MDDLEILTELRAGRRGAAELARTLGESTDCVRGALERLREEDRVYRTHSNEWAIPSNGRPRGAPRTPGAVHLDNTLYQLLCRDSATATQLGELVGRSHSSVYLSLSRLRKRGLVYLGGGRNPSRRWHVVDAESTQ